MNEATAQEIIDKLTQLLKELDELFDEPDPEPKHKRLIEGEVK